MVAGIELVECSNDAVFIFVVAGGVIVLSRETRLERQARYGITSDSIATPGLDLVRRIVSALLGGFYRVIETTRQFASPPKAVCPQIFVTEFAFFTCDHGQSLPQQIRLNRGLGHKIGK